MDKRKYNKGTVGNKGGRPSKADEQALIERLTPMADDAYNQLHIAVKNGESWAIKMFMEYYNGKPKETINQKTEIVVPDINWDE